MARKLGKTKEMQYNVSKHAFTNNNKNIEGTAIVAGKEYPDFYSIKNTIPNKIIGKIVAKPAYEIATAIRDIKKTADIICVGKDKTSGEKVYFGSFLDEEETEHAVLIYPETPKIIVTGPNENYLYSVIAAMNIAEFIMKGENSDSEDSEIYELLNKMEFGGPMIDSNQNDVYIPLCDSIYFESKKLNEATMVVSSYFDIIDIINDNTEVKYNLIHLVSKDEDLELEVDGEDVVIPKMNPPKMKSKKKLGKGSDKKETVKDYASVDYTLLTDEEANKMPKHIQLMRKRAIEFFEDNKQFLTEEQWSTIKSFKRGRLWKAGFYGPSATGKTSFVKCLAGALRLPYAIVVGSKGMDETKLFGKYVLKDGETLFEDGPLTEMMRYGGLFLLDEENMVSPEVISSMNSVLDDTRLVTLDSNEIVHCHPNFRYCEAMNIAYAGTLEQNLSHESRVQMWLKFKGYDVNTEAKIVAKETGIEESVAKQMIEVKNWAMDEIKNGADGDDTTQRVDLRSVISCQIELSI
jgi:hypothetical protein